MAAWTSRIVCGHQEGKYNSIPAGDTTLSQVLTLGAAQSVSVDLQNSFCRLTDTLESGPYPDLLVS